MRITESALRRIVREELREMKDDGSHKHHSGAAHRPFGNRPYPPGPPFKQPKLDDPGLEDKYKQMWAGLDTDDEPDANKDLFEGDEDGDTRHEYRIDFGESKGLHTWVLRNKHGAQIAKGSAKSGYEAAVEAEKKAAEYFRK